MSEYIWNILGSVTIVVIPILVRYLVVYLIEKRKQLQNSVKQSELEQFERSILEAIDIVERVVKTVAQTYVDSLKAQGNFTKEAQERSLKDAIETAKILIPQETQNLIETVYSDFDVWLHVQIESYIKACKEQQEAKFLEVSK